jgi:hypothetical protein
MFDNLTDEIKDDQIVGIKNHLTEITKKAWQTQAFCAIIKADKKER